MGLDSCAQQPCLRRTHRERSTISVPHWRETAEDPAAPKSHGPTKYASSTNGRFRAWLRRNAAMILAVVVLIAVVAYALLA
jgi:hypothetical protein